MNVTVPHTNMSEDCTVEGIEVLDNVDSSEAHSSDHETGEVGNHSGDVHTEGIGANGSDASEVKEQGGETDDAEDPKVISRGCITLVAIAMLMTIALILVAVVDTDATDASQLYQNGRVRCQASSQINSFVHRKRIA